MKPKVTDHSATYELESGGFLHIDRAIVPIRLPPFMIRFEDGPAAGQFLSLKSAPRFLRAVHDPHGQGKWDALDQPEDTPTASEKLFAYEVHGEVGTCHVYRRGGGRVSGFQPIAYYRIVPEQPAEDEMRDSTKWRAWCEKKAGTKPA